LEGSRYQGGQVTPRGRLALAAGIVVAGLSPSFVDWQQSPEYRGEIYLWYGAALALVLFGLWDGR
jgi:hypothetical protein